jgi:hypothetical protein
MVASASNLIAGPGVLYSADFGATEPVDTDVADAPEAPFVDYGATNDGVTLVVSKDTFKLQMDQTTEAPSRRVTERDTTIATNLAEITLENLADAWGQDRAGITTGVGFKALDITGEGDVGGEPPWRALIFDGPAPGGKKCRIIGRKMLSIENVETSYKKDGQTWIPATFAAHYVSASVKSVHVVYGT